MKFKNEKMKFNPPLAAEGKDLVRESQLVQSKDVALPFVNTADLKPLVTKEIDQTLQDTVKEEFGQLWEKFSKKRQEVREENRKKREQAILV